MHVRVFYWKITEDECVHTGVMFPLLPVGAGADRYP